MKRNALKCLSMILVLAMLVPMVFTGCGAKKEKVLIFTSVEDYVIEDMNKRLGEQFPNYDITVEYVSTGNHAAKLLTEQGERPTTAAISVGYTDLFNFSRMFKRYFGVSPRAYVEEHRDNNPD